MKALKILFCCLVFSNIFITSCNYIENPSIKNQTQESLLGLKLMSDKKVNIIDESTFRKIAYYSKSGKKLKKNQVNKYLNHGAIPEIYVDKKGIAKLGILSPPTEKEKLEYEEMLKEFDEIMRKEDRAVNTMIGKEAIFFSNENMRENIITLDQLKGKVVVLNFWFIECKPCKEEIPELNTLVEKYRDHKNIVFLAFAEDEKESLAFFLEKTPFLYEIFPNSTQISKAYHITSYPTHVVIDKNSKITYINSGFGNRSLKLLEDKIEETINK